MGFGKIAKNVQFPAIYAFLIEKMVVFCIKLYYICVFVENYDRFMHFYLPIGGASVAGARSGKMCKVAHNFPHICVFDPFFAQFCPYFLLYMHFYPKY